MRRAVCLALLLLACGDDAESPDAGARADDAGPLDAGPVDAATEDAFPVFDGGPLPGPLPACDVTPPDALLATPGEQDDGSFLALDGRRAVAAGPHTVLEGFPADVALHPTLPVAYVVVASSDDRRLDVLATDTFAILQQLEHDEVFFGLEVAPDGARVYLAGGASERLTAYDVAEDGTLTEAGTLDTGTYLAGTAISPDGGTLWLGGFDHERVLEVDTATLTERRRIALPPVLVDDEEEAVYVWDLVHLPSRDELYASNLRGPGVTVIDLDAGDVAETIPVPVSPAGLAVRDDDSVVWAAVSGSDTVVAIDTDTRSVVASALVAESNVVDDEGVPLPNSNVNALWFAAADDRLYVTRGADNAVSVLDASSLDRLGAIPSDWYPTDVELASDGRTLVVAAGKGGGAGPGGGAKDRLKGTVAFVDLLGLDLEAETTRAEEGFTRTADLYAPDCEAFPVPTEAGRPTPIEHVVLIVKENKTFDAILGDLEDPRVDADPSRNEWGLPFTPNHHALAEQFAHSDNFFVLAPNSDTGHLFLTATHLTEFAERIWLEDVRGGEFSTFPVQLLSAPARGNFFAHLLDHDVSVQIYGEIVGTAQRTADGTSVARFTDARFPGGPFTNYGVTDEEKARYVARQILGGELAQFTYLLLPNDHGNGTRPGIPTPESMVADNDYGMGIVIDALSHSHFWPSTVVFVVEDDPQGTSDHVDAHRSILHVVSPWARRDHVSHVHSSYLSVFATIERILGVPPLGRPDASAAPLYDMFTTEPDFTPYDAVERTYPREINPEPIVGAEMSRRMDFRGPDRNENLGELVRIYRRWRRGELPFDVAEEMIEDLDEDVDEGVDEDADEGIDEAAVEAAAFDDAYRAYRTWAAENGVLELPPLAELPGGPE